jgi:hypothetical protein
MGGFAAPKRTPHATLSSAADSSASSWMREEELNNIHPILNIVDQMMNIVYPSPANRSP